MLKTTFSGKIFLDEDNIIRTPELKTEQYVGGLGLFYFKQMKNHKAKIAQVSMEEHTIYKIKTKF